jgi:hypothetical protein
VGSDGRSLAELMLLALPNHVMSQTEYDGVGVV